MYDRDSVPRAEYEALLASIAAPGKGTRITPEMRERAWAEQAARTDAAVKERQEEAARLEREREAGRLAEGRARLDAYEAECRERILRAGGTEADVARAWPRLKDEYLAERAATDPEDEIYRRMTAGGVRRW